MVIGLTLGSKCKANNLFFAFIISLGLSPGLAVDPNVQTGEFLTGFYCNFDHPEQHQTMLLPVKNSRLILTCKCTYYT